MASSSLQFVNLINSDGTRASSLVPLHDVNMTDLSIDEQVSVFDARTLNDATTLRGIDFVFFRRFSDGRSSQVAAYVIDNSDEKLNEKQLSEIHLRVWLHGKAPLLYVAWPAKIDLLSCARGPDFWKERNSECQYRPAKTIDEVALDTAGEIAGELPNFSALRLVDGTFWEEPSNRRLADHNKAAHQLLIQAVVDADEELDGEKKPVLRRLLLLMVLIKYLEDRQVFPPGWFGKFHKGAQNFFEVLDAGSPDDVHGLLACLEKKFNGDVFSLREIGQQKLSKEILKDFSVVVEGRTFKKQRYLWRPFSFEHLPVEIISHLYQKFVKGDDGAVYTPPILASLLLDHIMPYQKLTGRERILDPACGSGVFLVGAFRRLINIWRSQNNWQRPKPSRLKELLRQSVYGIEIDRNAIDLTVFSLCLAVCDVLQPDVIWKDLKFDRLSGSNLIEADFFQVLLDSRQGKSTVLDAGFDIVVGNPPFRSRLSPAGIEVDEIAQNMFDRPPLPDNQVAYLFLEQALRALRPGGQTCLIQPAGFLYNSKTGSFRTSIFGNCKVETIFDFTSIRKLYEADAKTVAILAHADNAPDDHWIKHWTFRRTVSVQERICFELDHYDRHHVRQEQALEAPPFLWRANLLGGGRLYGIGQRFAGMRTLAEYVNGQGWTYGEGLVVGERVERKRVPALEGKPLLPTDAFTDSGIDEKRIDTIKEASFRSGWTEERFNPPMILIKENETLPIAFWDGGFLAYRAQIIGINALESQRSELRQFYEALHDHHETLRFACALNGTRGLVNKATAILKRDIDQLPYPDNLNDLDLSFWEKALCEDVLDYIAEYVRLGQDSKLLKMSVDRNQMRDYSSMFIRMLGSVYDNLKASEPVHTNGLTCQPFYFGERPDFSWLGGKLQDGLGKLIYDDKTNESLRTIRILRYCSENVLLMIKPDRLRYWIRSVAIRDADETLRDLRRQGY